MFLEILVELGVHDLAGFERNLRVVIVEWCVATRDVVCRVENTVLLEEVLDFVDHIHLEYAVNVFHVDAEKRTDGSPSSDLVLVCKILAQGFDGFVVATGDDEIVNFACNKNESIRSEFEEEAAIAGGLRVVKRIREKVRESLVP